MAGEPPPVHCDKAQGLLRLMTMDVCWPKIFGKPTKFSPPRCLYRGGGGVAGEGLRFCNSGRLILTPLPKTMSPGFWSAAQGPSHLASIVIIILPPGISSLCDVTVIV